MSNLLAIDPGTRGNLGWAMFIDGHLCRCGIGLDNWLVMRFDVVVFEHPEFYRRVPVDPNKLCKLVKQIGWIQGYLSTHSTPRFVEHLPKHWKGQTPKDVCARRAKRVLKDREQAVIQPNAPLDVWDAVALGLFELGRFTPAKIREAT